jgi:hypothetical protein
MPGFRQQERLFDQLLWQDKRLDPGLFHYFFREYQPSHEPRAAFPRLTIILTLIKK